MKHFVKLLFAFSLQLALALPGHATELHKLRLVYVPGIGSIGNFVALAKGYFKDEGLDVQMIAINTGPGAAAAVQSGSGDVGYSGAMPLIAARAEGIPFKYVLGGYYEQDGVYEDSVIIASNKSNIKTVADLKGKTVAINNFSGVNDQQLRIKLSEADIPVNDVNIITVPFPQMQAALEIGNADAVGTVDPFRTAILQKKLGHVIAHGYVERKDLAKQIPVGVFFATEKWIHDNSDALTRLKRAVERSNKFVKDHPDEAKKILLQNLRLPPTLLDAIKLPPLDTNIDSSGVQAIMDAAYSVGILKKPMQASELLVN